MIFVLIEFPSVNVASDDGSVEMPPPALCHSMYFQDLVWRIVPCFHPQHQPLRTPPWTITYRWKGFRSLYFSAIEVLLSNRSTTLSSLISKPQSSIIRGFWNLPSTVPAWLCSSQVYFVWRNPILTIYSRLCSWRVLDPRADRVVALRCCCRFTSQRSSKGDLCTPQNTEEGRA